MYPKDVARLVQRFLIAFFEFLGQNQDSPRLFSSLARFSVTPVRYGILRPRSCNLVRAPTSLYDPEKSEESLAARKPTARPMTGRPDRPRGTYSAGISRYQRVSSPVPYTCLPCPEEQDQHTASQEWRHKVTKTEEVESVWQEEGAEARIPA